MDAIETDATLFLPVGVPIEERHRPDLALPLLEALAELAADAVQVALPTWAILDRHEVAVLPGSASDVQDWFRHSASVRKLCPYTLRLSVRVGYQARVLRDALPDDSYDPYALAESIVSSFLEQAAGDLVLTSCLSHPDVANPWESIIVCNSNPRILRVSGLIDAAQCAREKSWPPIKTLAPRDVWTWMQRLDGFGLRTESAKGLLDERSVH